MPVQPQPCGSGSSGDTPALDVEGSLLCDVAADGTLIAVALVEAIYDEATGARTGTRTVNPATGAPYVPTGTLQPCGETCPNGTAQVYATCADVPKGEIIAGADLLENGSFLQSEGTGATSTEGPGWETDYTAAADIFAAGAATYALFEGNAGTVTGGNPSATPIPALSGKSFAVNVGPDTTLPLLRWQAQLITGKTYRFGADVAIIFAPYALKMAIDGTDITPLTAPANTGVWEHTQTDFVWTGTTGVHTLTIQSDSAAAAGNDHALDNLSLRSIQPSQPANPTSVDYCGTQRAVIDTVVSTTGCNDDRRDQILASLVANTEGGGLDAEVDRVCAAGVTLDRVRLLDGAGTAVVEAFYGANGTPVAAPAAYSIGECPCGDAEHLVLCDTSVLPGATPSDFTLTESQTDVPDNSFFHTYRTGAGYVQNPTTAAQEQAYWDSAGLITFPAAPGPASGPSPVFRYIIGANLDFNTACDFATGDVSFTADMRNTSLDDPAVPDPTFAVAHMAIYNKVTGNRLVFADWTSGELPPGGAPVLKSITANNIPASAFPNLMLVVTTINWQNFAAQGLHSNSFESEFHGATVNLDGMCSRVEFLRTLTRDCAGTVTATTDTTLDGTTPYTVTGDVGLCVEPSGSSTRTLVDPGTDAETLTLCDDNGPFLRTLLTDVNGALTVVRDSDLTGLPYAPVGTVKLCQPEDPPIVGEFVLCDDVGPFVRKLVQDAAGTVTAVVNLTLDGAAYTPVGTVKRCEDCPTVLGEICYSAALPGVARSDDWAGVVHAAGVWTNPNFDGTGNAVTHTFTPDIAVLFGTALRVNVASGGDSVHSVIDLGTPRLNVVVDFNAVGTRDQFRNITPAYTSLAGNAVPVGSQGADGGPATDLPMTLTFAGPVQTIAYDYTGLIAAAGYTQPVISYDEVVDGPVRRAARVQQCDGTVTLVDLLTGTAVDEPTVSVFDCPCCPTTTADLVCADGVPAIRRETVDADGVVTGAVFTTADGNVVTPATWTPGPCATGALTAQHKDVPAGTSWTPADAAGTVTALTYTVLAGTATVTDQNGTVVSALPTGLTVSWENNAEGTLSPPTSVAADPGSRVLVHWTEQV